MTHCSESNLPSISLVGSLELPVNALPDGGSTEGAANATDAQAVEMRMISGAYLIVLVKLVGAHRPAVWPREL